MARRYRDRARTESERRRNGCWRLAALQRARCACPCNRHTDLRKRPRLNAAGNARVRRKDSRTEYSWKHIRRALEFYRAEFGDLESARESSRVSLRWAPCGLSRVSRTTAPLLANSQM